MSKQPLAAATKWLVLILPVILPACGVPTVTVTTTPRDAVVWVDGREVRPPAPGAPIEIRRPYYGSTSIHSRQPGSMREDELFDLHHQMLANEPFSPWIFPFDFLLEAVTLPWNPDRYEQRVDLKLRTRPTPIGGVRPRNLAAFREHARRAVLTR